MHSRSEKNLNLVSKIFGYALSGEAGQKRVYRAGRRFMVFCLHVTWEAVCRVQQRVTLHMVKGDMISPACIWKTCMKYSDTWIEVLISCFCHKPVNIVTYNSFSAIQQVRARAQPIKPRPCARLRPSRCPAAAAANTTVNHQPHGHHTPAIHTTTTISSSNLSRLSLRLTHFRPVIVIVADPAPLFPSHQFHLSALAFTVVGLIHQGVSAKVVHSNHSLSTRMTTRKYIIAADESNTIATNSPNSIATAQYPAARAGS